ncbi:nucleoside-diphosphate kinase [Kitasatospora sp. NPDC057512]|uniref:nucleoside-diphosphate kinase n=1 Tax=Kitasatospora sp. NPDC057512 TaxID=3346154 RepID=UPI0036A1045D
MLSEALPDRERLSEVDQDVLDQLTWSPEKARMYSVEQYLRESCWTFGGDLPRMLGITLCMLKAEATAGRRLRSAVRALAGAGFEPVDVVVFRHDRQTIREVWRHHFNIATRDRVEAMDLILPSIDTVCLVLKDTRWAPGRMPAAIRLNSLKGPADPEQRHPDHLRHQLGVVNGLFNFMHCSDEPIDVFREISVLCDDDRRALMRERILADHDALPEVLAVFDTLESRHPAHDFDYELSWERLRTAPGRPGELAAVRAAGGEVALTEVMAATHGVPYEHPNRWDLLTVITHLLKEMNLPGVTTSVPNVTADWDGPR